MILTSHDDPSKKSNRSQEMIETQSPPTPDPSNTSEWVWANIQKNGEILSWWQEFQFLCHMGAKMLSEQEVQDLVRRQAVTFWIPNIQQEKSSWWNSHPAWLG